MPFIALPMAQTHSEGILSSKSFPGVSEHAVGRTDEIWPAHLLSRQSDDDGGRIRQSDLPGDDGSARERRALQMKEQEDTAPERADWSGVN